MYHRKKPSLTQRLSAGVVLFSSITGCSPIVEDMLAEGLNIAADQQSNPLDRDILKAGSRAVHRDVERTAKHNTELREAQVEIYKERGLSEVRVEEEKAMRNLERSYTQPEEPTLDTATQKALNQVLGKETINTGVVIKAIQEEYKRHPFDWERNTEMVANAYKLDLTSDDKNKLQQIIERMSGCIYGGVRSKSSIKKVLQDTYIEKEIVEEAFKNYLANAKNIHDNIDGKLKLIEFMINHQDTKQKMRSGLVVELGYYPQYIRNKSSNLPTPGAIDYIRSKISLLEKVKDNLSLSEKELKAFYLSSESGIGILETLLRTKLRKANPEFKEKEEILLNTIKLGEELTQPEVIGLARETGYLTRLRKTLNQIEIKSAEPIPEIVKELKPQEVPSTTEIKQPEKKIEPELKKEKIIVQTPSIPELKTPAEIKPELAKQPEKKIEPESKEGQPYQKPETTKHKEILKQKAKLEEEIAKLKQIRELEEEIAKLKQEKEKREKEK